MSTLVSMSPYLLVIFFAVPCLIISFLPYYIQFKRSRENKTKLSMVTILGFASLILFYALIFTGSGGSGHTGGVIFIYLLGGPLLLLASIGALMVFKKQKVEAVSEGESVFKIILKVVFFIISLCLLLICGIYFLVSL